jgi:thiol-disulfide isomerase/thioredoxin
MARPVAGTGWLLIALAALAGGLAFAEPPEPLPPLKPAGAEEVLAAVREPGARVVLVNVWATWCAPCLEELPDLLKLRREYSDRGLRLILVSGDFASARQQVRERLARLGVDFETYRREGDDMAFIEALDARWSGALPASFVYDGQGRLQHFEQGRATYEEFEKLISKVMRGEEPRAQEESR